MGGIWPVTTNKLQGSPLGNEQRATFSGFSGKGSLVRSRFRWTTFTPAQTKCFWLNKQTKVWKHYKHWECMVNLLLLSPSLLSNGQKQQSVQQKTALFSCILTATADGTSCDANWGPPHENSECCVTNKQKYVTGAVEFSIADAHWHIHQKLHIHTPYQPLIIVFAFLTLKTFLPQNY